MNPKSVTILTGFLGAGKTSYLNHLIKSNPNVRYAIIENEYGEVGIDSELIIRAEDGIVEMNNGCLCCTLNDNLYDILNDLHERRDDFDEIIIEATGVADPAGLAAPFLSHPLIKEHFPLRGTICLVDTEQIEDLINETEEAIQQLTFSDIILLNKIDLVSTSYLETVEKLVSSINPTAAIVQGKLDDFPEIKLESFKQNIEDSLEDQVEGLKEKMKLDLKADEVHHHHHEHTKSINSVAFSFDKPFDYDLLYHHLFVYLTFQSKGLYRIKGVLWVNENPKKVIIQSVGKRMSFDEGNEWELVENKKSSIVFIGKDLKEKGTEKSS